MSRQSGKRYIPARKGPKLYMEEPVVVEDVSITTEAVQKLVIDRGIWIPWMENASSSWMM